MAVKVYGNSRSPYVRIVLLVLSEKGVDYELVDCDHKSPEYLGKINPFGKIPAVDIDGFILYESRAIARYIASKYESQGPNLLGSTPEQKALVDQWVEVEGHSFNPPTLHVCVETVVKPLNMKEPDETVVAENCAKLEKVLDVYESRLAKCKYLAGDFYSVADMIHIPMLHNFVNRTGKGALVTRRKHVSAWWHDISSRPAWKKVLEKHET